MAEKTKQEKDIHDLNDKLAELNRVLRVHGEELAVERSDKIRFKDLSEGYMRKVAELEAQMEAAEIKPHSKMSQRPKDTVPRDQSHSLSNIHANKVKRVDAKTLHDVC